MKYVVTGNEGRLIWEGVAPSAHWAFCEAKNSEPHHVFYNVRVACTDVVEFKVGDAVIHRMSRLTGCVTAVTKADVIITFTRGDIISWIRPLEETLLAFDNISANARASEEFVKVMSPPVLEEKSSEALTWKDFSCASKTICPCGFVRNTGTCNMGH